VKKGKYTTFRTSVGTKVYVEAPEVYVTPGVKPEDLQAVWRSGGAGREALKEELREELDDLYIRSILKPTSGTDYSGGVGTPFLVEIQDEGIGPYLLFTGWKTTDGSSREVFIGEINEDFEVSNIRKIIAAGVPNAQFISHDAVHALYNPTDERWEVYTSSKWTGDGGRDVACLFRFDKTFSTLLESHAPLYFQDGTLWRTIDSGVSPVTNLTTYRAMWVAFVNRLPGESGGRGIYLTRTGDYRESPPVFYTPVRLIPGNDDFSGHGTFIEKPDILQLIKWKEHLVILAENLKDGEWNIYPYFIPLHLGTGISVHWVGVAGRASEALISLRGHHVRISFGHPHLTWLPNRKLNLFFAMFPNHPPSFRHEIWCMRLPEERLDPKNYRALIFYPWFNDSIEAGEATRPFIAYGRKTIHFTSDTSGNLTLSEDAFGDNNWRTVFTVSNVTEAVEQTTHSAPYGRLEFSEAATVSAVVIVEPNQ